MNSLRLLLLLLANPVRRIHWAAALAFMAAGRLARYAAVAWLSI